MRKRRNRGIDEETSYWLSYSDMMAALLLTFVLIISFTMLQSKRVYDQKQVQLEEQQKQLEVQQIQLDEQQEIVKTQQEVMDNQQKQLDELIGVRSELIKALKDEFDDTNLSVKVDEKTGSITFSASVLFDFNKYSLKDSGKDFLNEFIPRYFNVLLGDRFKEYVTEVIIEGHTDTSGDYLYNLELSQKRALSVAYYCLDENENVLPIEEVENLRRIVTANGKSFSDPIYNSDGSVNMDESRRVEFKFRLKDQEMIERMKDILSED